MLYIRIIGLLLAYLSVTCILQSWPLRVARSITEEDTGSVPVLPQPVKPFTLVLDPAGDKRHPGRIIDDSFEYEVTFQYAQELKHTLEKHELPLRIIITKTPGELVEPLQSATFANRLPADLYIHIGCSKPADDTIPRLFTYYAQYYSTDTWDQQTQSLTFIPYNQAYRTSLKASLDIVTHIDTFLKKHEKEYSISLHKPIGCPFKPLVPIATPSLAWEFTLPHKRDYIKYIEPLAAALIDAVLTFSYKI